MIAVKGKLVLESPRFLVGNLYGRQKKFAVGNIQQTCPPQSPSHGGEGRFPGQEKPGIFIHSKGQHQREAKRIDANLPRFFCLQFFRLTYGRCGLVEGFSRLSRNGPTQGNNIPKRRKRFEKRANPGKLKKDPNKEKDRVFGDEKKMLGGFSPFLP